MENVLMDGEIARVVNAQSLLAHLDAQGSPDSAQVLAVSMEGGLFAFLASVFRDLGKRHLLFQHFRREPTGRGAHFDVYGDQVDVAYPWVAVFNLAGTVSIRIVRLPDVLARVYAAKHPEPSDAAFHYRRELAAESLARRGSEVRRGLLKPNCGFLLPQFVDGPHWVHEVTPLHATAPGSFLKVLVPAQAGLALSRLSEYGYVSLEALLAGTRGRNPDVPDSPALESRKTRKGYID